MPVTVLRELPGWGKGDACLVQRGDEYFVVSSVPAYSGFETLVFRSDAEGEVTHWGGVAGGRGMSREAAIKELADQTGGR